MTLIEKISTLKQRNTMTNIFNNNIKRQIKNIIFRHYGLKTITIKDINLIVDFSDDGGRAYNSRSSHEEYVSPIYKEIASLFNPKLIIDVGANYGFTGIIFAKKFPEAKLILIEPSPRLSGFIHQNFEVNNLKNYKVINALCSDSDNKEIKFSLNPNDSQDNRVVGMDGWKSILVSTVSLDRIIRENYTSGYVFIKIDTEGFEERVFSGAEAFLLNNDNWLIKAEFAPSWLKSQGTDPLFFLRNLIANYLVTEAPARYGFNNDNLENLFKKSITIEESEEFLAYVVSLNEQNLGWCDLLVKPKGN